MDDMVLAVLATAMVVFVVLFGIRSKLNTGKKDLPPVVTDRFTGAVAMFMRPIPALQQFSNDGRIEALTVPVLWKKITFVTGPVASLNLFHSGENLLSQKEVYKFSKPLFGRQVVFDAPLHTRLEQFRFFSNSLRGKSLQNHVLHMATEVKNFTGQWNSGVLDLQAVLKELVMRTSTVCLLGHDFLRRIPEVERLIVDLESGFTLISMFCPSLPIPAHRKRDAARRELSSLFKRMLRSRANEEQHSVLHMLSKSRYKSGKPLSDEEITGMLIAGILGGQHTTAAAAFWTGLYLMHHKQWMHEVVKALPARDKALSFNDVSGQEVLRMSVKEATRLHPPTLLLRHVRRPISVSTANGTTYTVPAGHVLATSPLITHKLSTCFENAGTFDPGRWRQPLEKLAYIAFGAGRRACLGEQFAFLQIQTIWTVLLQEFQFDLVTQEIPELEFGNLLAGPKNRVLVRYTRK